MTLCLEKFVFNLADFQNENVSGDDETDAETQAVNAATGNNRFDCFMAVFCFVCLFFH